MSWREGPYESVQTWNDNGGGHESRPYIIRLDANGHALCVQGRMPPRSAADLPVIEGEFHEL